MQNEFINHQSVNNNENGSNNNNDKKIRVVKGLFNLPITSNHLTPEELFQESENALSTLHLFYVKIDDFTLSCIYNSSKENVEIELEIVKVWLMGSYGIRIRRVSGSTWLYKQIYDKITATLVMTSKENFKIELTIVKGDAGKPIESRL
eukprot:Pgem_evm1s5676